jgi:asparagine synthase (glutamine-hydrolysing)
MTIVVSFPKTHPTMTQRDLLVLGPARRAMNKKLSRTFVRMKKNDLVGRYDANQITVFLSGTLTDVPDPFKPGMGADAASIVATLYGRLGTHAFHKIDGAFLAVVFDWRRGSITVARDKLGIARAYFLEDNDTITVSDSLAGLLDLGVPGFSVDINSIYAFLTIGWVPTPHSMFQGVAKLPAGTLLESRDGRVHQQIYYDVPHSPSVVTHRSATELKRGIIEHLDRSIRCALGLGGGWGSFLSGGVDSSSVVASLAHVNGAGFPTYFGGFAPELNRYLPNPEEPAISQLVADRVGTRHRMLWLAPDTLQSIRQIIVALEEPVCDGGCLILGAIMRNARQEIDGLMTGIGGDFLFTGERRHIVLNLLRLTRPVPDFAWRAIGAILSLPPLARNARLSQMNFDLMRLLAVRELSLEDMYTGFFLQGEPTEMQMLFFPEARAMVIRDPAEQMKKSFDVSRGCDSLTQFLYLDLKHQASEHCVREAEMLGRYFGLKIHNPFLNAGFVDFAMSIPSAEKVSGLNSKVPLKSAMRGRLPSEVLDRKKGGLGSPIRWWVAQPDGLVAHVLSRRNIERRGIFSPDIVERFRAETAAGTHDHTKLLWSLFTLEIWMQEFIDRAGAADQAAAI